MQGSPFLRPVPEISHAAEATTAFVDDAYAALTDFSLNNKMISLRPATPTGSIDLGIDPDVLVDLLLRPGAGFKIGSAPLLLASGSQRSTSELRRFIRSLQMNAEVIASEQGIETLRLAMGTIAWKDADNKVRTAPLFTMPITITSDLVIAAAGSVEPNETFPLFAASFGCHVRIAPNKPPSQALELRTHSEGPVRAGSFTILGYHPRVNLNLYAGKCAAMHRALDRAARPHLPHVGALRALSGVRGGQYRLRTGSPNLHIVQADPSQDDAISMARAGVSFVLQGPPGTGKTQTIINIVANLLRDGKRVLVAAEKIAALEVIASRWPVTLDNLPRPVQLTEAGPALSPEARFAVASPAVAALKIPPGTGFDAVIVDEASQIRLSHAAVVAALAEQIVVIGDSQQMPPSTHFSSASRSSVSGTMIKSLLDHAVAADLPTTMLTQHYRSKHESLIMFSNDTFYDGRLDIVPSPVRDGSLGTIFRFVPDAIYDRGGGADNLIEAHAIISDAVALARENQARRGNPHGLPPRSVGIVTLNENQRNLIMTLLPNALAKEELSDVDLAGPCGTDKVFVKALENVQGDERDIILVSATYGHDYKGHFIANLGLLTKPGSAKRVNVMATRARWRTIVYHSFDIERLADSQSGGASALWGYWALGQTDAIIPPVIASPPNSDPIDELDAALRILQRSFRGERYWVHRFPRFLVGYAKRDPHHYLACFYFTGLFSRLKEASDLARIKYAGWRSYPIPIDEWRVDPDRMIQRIWEVMATFEIRQIGEEPLARL